jgi:tetraacyldisaccharide 4'-kinase
MFISQLSKSKKEQNLFFRGLSGLIAALYYVGLKSRLFCYDRGLIQSEKLPGKTISIGNLVMGGTGKSPVVVATCKELSLRGQRPAILTRGYHSGLKSNQWVVLLGGNIIHQSHEALDFFGDEAIMQSHQLDKTPVIVGAKRHRAAMAYLSRGHVTPTHWVMDDGFQHLKIKRDLNILLLDAKAPFANGRLFPGGKLREPIEAMARADILMFTRSENGFPNSETIKAIQNFSQRPHYSISFEQQYPVIPAGNRNILFDTRHQPVLAVCAIADPNRFVAGITSLNIKVARVIVGKDHQRIERKAIEKRLMECHSILTTEKDYWRDPSLFDSLPKPTFVMPLSLTLPQEVCDLLIC